MKNNFIRKYLGKILLLGGLFIFLTAMGEKKNLTPIEKIQEHTAQLLMLVLWLFTKSGRLGLVTWASVKYPQKAENSMIILKNHPVKSFITGFITALILLFLIAIVGELGKGGAKPLSGFVLAIFAIAAGFTIYFCAIGMAAVYANVNNKMSGKSTDAVTAMQEVPGEICSKSFWQKALRGGILVESGTLIPVIGTIIMTYLTFSATGASIISYFRFKNQPVEQKKPE